MVSVRETLGKRFLLLARTGQGLLAFAKPNRLSDQDKIQNFPPSLEKKKREDSRRIVGAHASSSREAAWPLCLIDTCLDRWKAPCWPKWAFLP